LPAGGKPTNGVIENVILPPKFLIGNHKAETKLRFELIDETQMRRTKWFRKQMNATFCEGCK
jgi:hypothetical protein